MQPFSTETLLEQEAELKTPDNYTTSRFLKRQHSRGTLTAHEWLIWKGRSTLCSFRTRGQRRRGDRKRQEWGTNTECYIVFKVPKATTAPMQQDIRALSFCNRQWTRQVELHTAIKEEKDGKLHPPGTPQLLNKHAVRVSLFSEAHIRLWDCWRKKPHIRSA